MEGGHFTSKVATLTRFDTGSLWLFLKKEASCIEIVSRHGKVKWCVAPLWSLMADELRLEFHDRLDVPVARA
jgi:hypothetical protein